MDVTFPYKPRPGQETIIACIARGYDAKTPLILESGTGTGKTVTSLYGLFSKMPRGKKLLYLTRTNTQQLQVLTEMREVSPKGMPLVMGMRGRNNLCPMIKKDGALVGGSPDELSRWCATQKNKTGPDQGCPYFSGLKEASVTSLMDWARDEMPTVEEWGGHLETLGICPYEGTKITLKECEGVVAPYIFFFNGHIRGHLLDWMGVPIEDLVVVVDEAHNLPDFARDLSSSRLSSFSLSRAKGEAVEFDDPSLTENLRTSEYITELQEILESLVEEFVVDEDGFVPPNQLQEDMMFSLGKTSLTLKRISIDLMNIGEGIKWDRAKKDKLPRSYIHGIGAFMDFWEGACPEQFLKLALKEPDPALETYCLDPSLVTHRLKDCHFSMHMSGTLKPLDEYRDSIGLPPHAALETIPSPFPKENFKKVYDPRFTTKHDVLASNKEMLADIAKEVGRMLRVRRVNTGLFFTSYAMKKRIWSMLEETDRPVFHEKRGMTNQELSEMVSRFKEKRGGILASVMGGRISEGLDFPGETMELALIVGVPYPPPSARSKGLIRYYDMKFNKGWEYVVRTPASRRLAQTIGRIIRSESDRGMAVLFDERASRFRDELGLKAEGDPVRSVRVFFEKDE